MADFKTHLTVSTVVGVGYGVAGLAWLQMPPATAAVAAGLCGIGGILPDVDSDSGQTVREVMGFAAAVVPLLLIDQLRQFGLSHDGLVLAGGCVYIAIRFGLGEILKRYTVHRGMWHSIPAALVAGLTTSLICGCDEPTERFFKVAAVMLGYLIHLSLDELYSIQLYRGRVRLKKSFGTAMKLWGQDLWANLAVFAKLCALVYLTLQDPVVRGRGFETKRPLMSAPREAVRPSYDIDLRPLERR